MLGSSLVEEPRLTNAFHAAVAPGHTYGCTTVNDQIVTWLKVYQV